MTCKQGPGPETVAGGCSPLLSSLGGILGNPLEEGDLEGELEAHKLDLEEEFQEEVTVWVEEAQVPTALGDLQDPSQVVASYHRGGTVSSHLGEEFSSRLAEAASLQDIAPSPVVVVLLDQSRGEEDLSGPIPLVVGVPILQEEEAPILQAAVHLLGPILQPVVDLSGPILQAGQVPILQEVVDPNLRAALAPIHRAAEDPSLPAAEDPTLRVVEDPSPVDQSRTEVRHHPAG